MMALHGVSVGWCQVTVDDITGMQLQQQSVCGPTARLLMVHAALTLAVNVWLCGITHI